MPIGLFSDTYALLEKTMDLRSQRHTVISSNIANAETPNYKSGKVDFEDELRRAVPQKNEMNLKTSNARHISLTVDIEDIKPQVVLETTDKLSADKNTVDLDKEFVSLSKNKLMYDVSAEIISMKFKGLLKAIKETK
jgi:flagellar basal-body rod protein FlgB